MSEEARGTTRGPTFNETKFRELVLYIADRCEDHAHYGVAKLNKLLFLADFSAYFRIGKSITGASYLAQEFGPVPEPMDRVQQSMIEAREIGIRQNGHEKRVVALRQPDLRHFTAMEIATVDAAIDHFQTHTTRSISNLTHGFSGWLAAWRESQVTGKPVVIPYESILITTPELDPFEEARIREMAVKRGWLAKRPIGAQS